jgi:apolipoprotein D and lipocalin family protein
LWQNIWKAVYLKLTGHGRLDRKVKKWILAVCALILPLATAATTSAQTQDKNAGELKTVSFVDLKRYGGTWYEIARYPNKSQKQCIGNTTATYNFRGGEEAEIVSRCLTKDGRTEDASGTAKIVDPKTNAKLKGSFAWLSSAPVWVIDLDENYQYAVVGNPGRKYLWILSRSPEMSDATYQKILRKIETAGYNPAKLEKTPQNLKTVKGSVVKKQ